MSQGATEVHGKVLIGNIEKKGAWCNGEPL